MRNTGEAVTYVDEFGREHPALLVAVHGAWGQENEPSVNLAWVSADEKRTDQYGRQLERESSVVHKSNQAAHGKYWY